MERMNFSLASNEVRLDPNRSIFYKFTPDGVIEYVNDYFVEFTGFEAFEMLGKNVQDLKHPEVPQSIYDLVTERFTSSKNTNLLLKDTTKKGQYFWYLSDFDFKVDADNKVTSIVSLRKPVPAGAIKTINAFYIKLTKIEQNAGMETAKKYLMGFLEEEGMSFTEYTKSLIAATSSAANFMQSSEVPKKKKSFWRR